MAAHLAHLHAAVVSAPSTSDALRRAAWKPVHRMQNETAVTWICSSARGEFERARAVLLGTDVHLPDCHVDANVRPWLLARVVPCKREPSRQTQNRDTSRAPLRWA